MRILALSFILLSGILGFTSCGEAPVFTKSYSFANNEWKQDVKPVFKVTIPDTVNYYNIAITLRTTTDYSYSNLWFFLHTKTPKGQTGREPIEIKIAHPDGSWVGEKSGTVVETKVMFNHRKFPQAGVYTFTFEQGITEQIAKEVMDISYTVTKDISNEN